MEETLGRHLGQLSLPLFGAFVFRKLCRMQRGLSVAMVNTNRIQVALHKASNLLAGSPSALRRTPQAMVW